MKLKLKVMAVVIPPLVLLALVSLMGMLALRDIIVQLKNVAEKNIPLTSVVSSITEHQLEQAIWVERALRYGAKGLSDKFTLAEETFAGLGHLVEQEIETGERIAEEASMDTGAAAFAREFDEILTHLAEIEAAHAEYARHAEEVFKLLRNGDFPELETLAERVEREEETLYGALRKLETRLEESTRESMRAAIQREESAARIMVIGLIVFTLIGLLAFPLLLLLW